MDISVVIPTYNSASIYPELYQHLIAVLEKEALTFELLSVVDGSPDNVAEVIRSYAAQDHRVKLIEFSRNFGHQSAVTAGLLYATGDMVVIMDDDMEDPPEVLPRMIEKARAGYDVVYGIRRTRKVGVLRNLSYRIFYRLLNVFSIHEMPTDAGDFCLMRRPVVDALNALPERNRYVRGLRSWVGFNQTGVEYDRSARYAGESGYSLRKYFSLAFDGLLSFSYQPLYFMSFFGVVVATISFLLGFRLILLVLVKQGPDVPGWASLIVIMTFLGGVQLIGMGVMGQYIARIYDEVKMRPQFIVKETIGLSQEKKGHGKQPTA